MTPEGRTGNAKPPNRAGGPGAGGNREGVSTGHRAGSVRRGQARTDQPVSG